jgi:hypothetical protein
LSKNIFYNYESNDDSIFLNPSGGVTLKVGKGNECKGLYQCLEESSIA